jgi:polar amino acid transport system substrate-binding protein
MKRRRFGFIAALLCLAAALCACGSTNNQALRSSLAALRTQAATSSSTPDPDRDCPRRTWSLRPTDRPGPSVQAIRQRGFLRAGVDQNTLLLEYANPLHGQRLEGFEIDLLRQISRALFGTPGRIHYVALTTAERKSAVQDRTVDIVADAYTITCFRRTEMDFSSVYLDAAARVLVQTGSSVRSLADLRGKRVCATRGSTSLAALTKLSGVIPHPEDQRTDCLVDLQRGEVEAITSDDAILEGFQAQDPYTKLIGPALEAEPYGMAMSRSRPDLVRFVNGVLARMRGDGTWERLYRKWLPGTPRQPPVHYAD